MEGFCIISHTCYFIFDLTTIIIIDISPLLYAYVGSSFDFDSTPQNITITAGNNSSMVNIPVTDDDIVEGDETFSMSLTVPSSLGPGVRTGTITSATVTINDTTSELCYRYCLFPFL